MRHSTRPYADNDRQMSAENSRFSTLLADVSPDDSAGVLNAIDEALQELITKRNSPEIQKNGEEVEESFACHDSISASFEGSPDGQRCTSTDVTNALKRGNTIDAEEAKNGAAESSDPMKESVRSRIRRRATLKKNRKDKNEQDGEWGIFGTASTPSKWSLSHYLQSVASTREKRVAAVSAWFLALIGLIISLVFVTKDFVESKTNLASTTQYVSSDKLSLPTIWACSTSTQLPTFSQQPTERFAGQPLMWVDFARGVEQLNATLSGKTPTSQFAYVRLNRLGEACPEVNFMDSVSFFAENSVKPKCFACLALLQANTVELHKQAKDSSGASGLLKSRADSVSLRVSQHAFLSACRTSRRGLSYGIFRFFRQEVKSHARALRKRGILEFGSLDPLNDSDDQFLWPRFRMGYSNSTVDFAVYDVVDMFCNVYMFSDFYYPSTSKNVTYKFNSRYFRWERAGTGPYYPPDFDEYYGEVIEARKTFNFNADIARERYEDQSAFTGQSLQILTNSSRRGETDMLATLEPNAMANIFLTRKVIEGRDSYDSQTFSTKVWESDVRTVNFVYYMDLSYGSFLTRMVSDQATVSWPAFIADFFGLTSLFLDVSVYTLIVSPIIMRSRKRALLARKQKQRAENVV